MERQQTGVRPQLHEPRGRGFVLGRDALGNRAPHFAAPHAAGAGPAARAAQQHELQLADPEQPEPQLRRQRRLQLSAHAAAAAVERQPSGRRRRAHPDGRADAPGAVEPHARTGRLARAIATGAAGAGAGGTFARVAASARRRRRRRRQRPLRSREPTCNARKQLLRLQPTTAWYPLISISIKLIAEPPTTGIGAHAFL